MKPTASAFSLAPSDILMNVFHTSIGDPESLAPTLITADLTPFAGQTVRLRIAQTDDQEILNAGVDDVRIASTPSVTAASPTGVTAVGAMLSGTVNPGGLATTYHFEYGTTTAYGTSTSSQSAGADTATHNESAVISLNGPARVTFKFTQPGGARGQGQVRRGDQAEQAQAQVAVVRAALVFNGHAGLSSVHFNGRISPSKELKPGSYTLIITIVS